MDLRSNYLQQSFMYVLAILLTIIFMPASIASLRPFIMVLLLYYWAMQPINMLPVFWVWCFGLLLDLVSGTTLGQHALVLVIIDLALKEVRPRLSLYGFWQHSLLMLLLVIFYVLLQSWFMINISNIMVSSDYYFGVIGTMFVWAIMYFVMRSGRRKNLI
jgi:rod shape-determining protein MreD